MQVNHQINMTSLFADFSKLQESISIETIDVQSVQDTLKKVNIMKDLDNFNPTQLHLEKLSHLSTWTAVLFWLIAALAVVATCCCCYCLCPACCGQCITCLCTSLCKCIPVPKIPKRIANPMRAFSTNTYETPIHFQTDTSHVLIPHLASAPIERNQVTSNKNANNGNIILMNFESKPPQKVYPALPEAEDWIPIKKPNRKVFKCGDIYYCLEKRKCFNKDGSPSNKAPPTYDQIQTLLKTAANPPPVQAEYLGTSDKPIITWKFSETEELIWTNNVWHSKDNQRFYYGYGPPAPKSTPAKN